MNHDETSLADILSDEPLSTEVAEAVEVETPEATDAGQPRDDSGRFAAKTGVDGQETAAQVPPTDKLPQEDYKALRDEREKRQAAEARIAALEQQIQQPHQQPEPAPSIWEDEQRWQQNFGGQVVSQAVQQASLNARLDMSEMMVRQANPDFEDVKAEFLALATKNPQLAEQALADAHPWNKAYDIAKNHRAMTELGATNVAELRAQIEAKIREELAAQQPQPAPSLPNSLANAQSARSAASGAYAGPTTLADLLK